MSQTTITVELGTAEGNGIPLTLLATVPENKPIQPSQAATESTEVNPIPEANTRKSWVRTTIVISILAGVSFLNTMGSGILTVALPRIAEDLSLSENLLLWPASIYALTAGCTLLIASSIADVVGSRIIFIFGCLMFVIFTLGCGFARTGPQLIGFRALLGVAIAMCLPTAVSIVTHTFPAGKRRNIAFACLGAGQPLGFSVGLLLGGLFADTIGWRWGYYLSAIINIILFAASLWGLPRQQNEQGPASWQRLWREIDWIGAILISASLGLLSYVLAMVTASYTRMSEAPNIAMLCIGVLLLPTFVLWVGRQERCQKPAIIPNSLWANRAFTCICICVFLTWAAVNALQYFATLFFQRVQGASSITTSLQFLPMVISGALTNVFTGFFVNRVSARLLVIVSAIISSISPLLMAIADPRWTYWAVAFPAILLCPINIDVLFTTSNLIITKAFPSTTQALAGGVFNTISQIGNSVGLAVTAAIAASVTAHRTPSDGNEADPMSPEMLLLGYRAVFWTLLASMLAACAVSVVGLRKVGVVGLKHD